MAEYIGNIFLLILFGVILLWYKPSLLNKKIFCVLATSQWVLLSGLRHISIGPDTYSYKVNFFDPTIYESWGNVMENFVDVIFKGAPGKDPGYQLFEKLIQIFTTNYQLYLVFIALIFTVSLGIWTYKNSSEPLISFLIYSCLFYSFFAITGHRQTIATALVVFIGYKFIKERKFWPFLILVLVGYTIHKSSVSFLLFYFIANKKITKKYLITMFVFIITLFVFKNQVMVVLGNFMGYEDFINQFEGAGTWTFTSVLILITGVTFWKYKVMLKNNPQVTHFINALLLALTFIPLTFVDPSGMRVVQYFSLFLMLLIPEIIKSFKVSERVIVYYVAATVIIGLFIKNNPQYIFFWQG
ncbi:EpsG family protein [Neobacillus drentensis]|uniref:EpsG family protein n=1 Tax=Neobacillus drentensis TaxID=220684 RepID=UPI002FFDA275